MAAPLTFSKQLRRVSPQTANEVARTVNEMVMVVTRTAIEFDLFDPAQDGTPARTEPTPSRTAGTLQPRPCHTPPFPPGLGYDTSETFAHVARGDRVIGRGFGFEPPLVPLGTLPVPSFVPSMPRAMMSASQSLADAALLGSLSNRALARRAAASQILSSSGVGNINNPQRVAPVVEQLGGVLAGRSTNQAPESTTSTALPYSLRPTSTGTTGVPSAESSSSTKQPQGLVRSPHEAKMTWAKVAATPASEPTGADITISSSSHSSQPTGPKNAVGPSNPDLNEPLAEQRRVVWIRGCSNETTLRFISEKINEGALMSVLFDMDPNSSNANSRAACVIFHRAAHAQEFMEANQTLVKETGLCRYGKGYSIEPGLPWPADDEIRAMEAQPHQTRRLTVVGKGLFLRVLRKRFEADIIRIAGESNVELIWLYNHGNATVVLASVRVARVVHDRLIARASSGGSYGGAIITYSADPCETTMALCTQLRPWE